MPKPVLASGLHPLPGYSLNVAGLCFCCGFLNGGLLGGSLLGGSLLGGSLLGRGYGGCLSGSLADADLGGTRTLGAVLYVEFDTLVPTQGVEALNAAAMEEVFLPVFGCDEAETSVSDELFDGSCGHFSLLFLELVCGPVTICPRKAKSNAGAAHVGDTLNLIPL